MAYDLREINHRVRTDPKGFVEECDAQYMKYIRRAADRIIENMQRSPIVLLSGPSGSGKTTTAMKIEAELQRRGVGSHAIAMDNYFLTVTPEHTPRTPEGDYDFESPLCLDIDLLNEHFAALSRHEPIIVPKYEFSRHMRILEPSKRLRLAKDEIAVFEGIHALNDAFTQKNPKAFKLYISARSNIVGEDGNAVFKGTWMRLVRRVVRDSLFRGTNPAETMAMWANIRRGEKLYISPYKSWSDLMLDTAMPYEVSLMAGLAPAVFATIPEGIERYDELQSILPAFGQFEPLDMDYLANDALLREFVGGGIYAY